MSQSAISICAGAATAVNAAVAIAAAGYCCTIHNSFIFDGRRGIYFHWFKLPLSNYLSLLAPAQAPKASGTKRQAKLLTAVKVSKARAALQVSQEGL
jgi:hypothetical protein